MWLQYEHVSIFSTEELAQYLNMEEFSSALEPCFMPPKPASLSMWDIQMCEPLHSLFLKAYEPYSRYNWKYSTDKDDKHLYIGVTSDLSATKTAFEQWTENIQFLCLNDQTTDGHNSETLRALDYVKKTLHERYPKKSFFEK